MRLVIGGPTLATVPARFALDLAPLYAATVRAGIWSSVTLGYVQSTYVHVGREAVLAQALQIQATHVLWLDTDMTCPADTAIRLMAHDRLIVAANGVTKTDPPLCVAHRGGQRIETRPDSHGLEDVDSVGMAVMLMATDVAKDLARPWFSHGRTDTGADIGEDVQWCRTLRGRGHRIYIDHDLSKEIGHIGQYTFRPRVEAALAV